MLYFILALKKIYILFFLVDYLKKNMASNKIEINK